jgi:anti-sigma factor (TIGR02949 family)
MGDLCDKCEEMMQPYLDGVLSEAEIEEARMHLERCPPCEKRYRFEESLRRYVRVATDEPMPEDLKARLAALRTQA